MGFQNVDSLRKALDIVLGLLSTVLLEATQGKDDPAQWEAVLEKHTLTDLIKRAVALAQDLHHDKLGKRYPYLFELTLPSDSSKDLLVLFATARDGGRWVGHDRYLAAKDRIGQAQAEDRLVRLIMARLLQVPPGSVSLKHPALEDALTADEVINAAVFRVAAGLGFGSAPKRIALRKDDFVRARAAYDAKKAPWLKAARERYDALVAEIPEALRPALGKEEWFAAHLKGGPPKIGEKTRDLATAPAVEGLYFLELIEAD